MSKTPEQIAAEAATDAAELNETIEAAELGGEVKKANKVSLFRRPWARKIGWGMLIVGVVAGGAYIGLKCLNAEAAEA